MSDLRDILERGVGDATPPSSGFERMLRRRERKQRNRQIRAGAIGIAVTVAVGLFLVRSLTLADVPADQPVEPTPVSGALAYALDGDVYVAAPDGSDAVKIAAPDEACVGDVASSIPSWSPDGAYLAFQRECSDPDRSVVVITQPDGTVVTEFPGSGFGWSPDSTRIAAWEDFSRTVGIYGLDGVRQASLPSPSTGAAAENAPGWTPDGSAAVIILVDAGQPTFTALPLDGSPTYELSRRMSIVSPDGTRIVVIGDHSAVITDADGATVSNVDMPLRGAVWSPAGDRFASVSRRGELVVVDAASGKVTVLTEARAALSDGEFVNVVRGFSPGGDRILYSALVRDGGAGYNDLYSIGVDGSDPRLLVVGAMQGQWRPR